MKNLLFNKKHEYLFLFLILCLASFLFLKNLGNQYLWQDEAETALVSKTILTYGIPKGYDGKNYFSQNMGKDVGKNHVWKWAPWLQYYLTAASFLLLGTNNFSARLPFALFGIATVILVYFFSLYLWKDRRAACIAAILVLFSVPFLILSRQSRYYTLITFFSLYGLYSYLYLIDGKKYAQLKLIVSSILLFHTAFPYCIILLASISIHSLIWYRDKAKRVIIISGLVVLINFPWLVWVSDVPYGSTNIKAVFKFLTIYTSLITRYIFNPLLLFIPIILGAMKWRKTRRFFSEERMVWNHLSLLLLFIMFTVMVASLRYPFFRYLAPLIPLFCAVTALIIESVSKRSRMMGAVILLIIILLSPIKDFLYEITHDYDGPIEGIVKYLNENGTENDTVVMPYGDLSLKFYTNMKILGPLSGENWSLTTEADWIVWRKYISSPIEPEFKRYLLRHVVWGNYQKIFINYPDIPFENREDPVRHKFRTVENEDGVVIYRKIR